MGKKTRNFIKGGKKVLHWPFKHYKPGKALQTVYSSMSVGCWINAVTASNWFTDEYYMLEIFTY